MKRRARFLLGTLTAVTFLLPFNVEAEEITLQDVRIKVEGLKAVLENLIDLNGALVKRTKYLEGEIKMLKMKISELKEEVQALKKKETPERRVANVSREREEIGEGEKRPYCLATFVNWRDKLKKIYEYAKYLERKIGERIGFKITKKGYLILVGDLSEEELKKVKTLRVSYFSFKSPVEYYYLPDSFEEFLKKLKIKQKGTNG